MARKLNNAHKAEIVLVTGSSGALKTTWMKKIIKRRKRVIVYDAAKHEYGDVCTPVKSQRELLALIRQHKTGPLKVAYQPERPSVETFTWWANLVIAWGDCTAVAEEISDVTTPGKAPAGWGDLLRKGRAYGIKVFGLTQRPAESDKTIIGNATLIHAGRQSRFDDQKYMSKEMNLSPEDFKMKPGEWVEYDLQTLEHKRGITRWQTF